MITDFHSQLYANELILKAPLGTLERFATALFDSKVDLNPHQVDAALFAFKSPLSKGALLADEVGLGKTIEAGILIAQKWAERKRRILIIVPANLRKQWLIELEDKFNLPAKILEAKSFNEAIRNGNLNPFLTDAIVITSYAFARNKEPYIQQTPLDLAVIDEAHRLRNVYKSGNKVGASIKNSLANIPKVLLTATPLQNNLMELYGLVSIIDPYVFGDEKSFREIFEKQNSEASLTELRKRLENICKRTLRKQVLKYIKYTKRHAYTQEFHSTKDEENLYNEVSEYLRRENLKALPNSQRKLMVMILRKLLASSTFALSATLEKLISRLEKMLKDDEKFSDAKAIVEDFETVDEYDDNFDDADNDSDENGESEDGEKDPQEPLSEHDKALIKREIEELQGYHKLATGIRQNSKGLALLTALEKGFDMAQELGGARKVVIFTESRRTQDYLWELLSESGYAGKIMLFNGTNTDKTSQEIYRNWKEKNPEHVTASKSADMRTALVEHFKGDAQIMIATEAAAEGINLQFCSLVVNYDLPWNPQRIEQRIGRCHRYGQKHDVVVVNFLNLNNEADRRVYELLKDKLKLFDGIFGASDEILGALGNGIDFEKRIAELYQKCRTTAEIQIEFDFIQERFSTEIKENVRQARKKLIENFDAEVAERLNVWQENTHTTIDRLQVLLWGLTRHELGNERGVFFDEENMTFQMLQLIEFGYNTKKIFGIKRTSEHCEQYGVSHPLAQRLIQRALNRDLPYQGILFDYENARSKVSALERLPKKSGKLTLSKLKIGEDEEHLIISCIDDLGNAIDQDIARRLFNLKSAKAYDLLPFDDKTQKRLDEVLFSEQQKILEKNLIRDTKIFDDEVEKLEKWSDDRKASLEIKLKEIDKSIKEMKKEVRSQRTLEEKVAMQRKQSAAESERMALRKKLFVMQDEIDSERDRLISAAESAMRQETQAQTIFSIEWRIV